MEEKSKNKYFKSKIYQVVSNDYKMCYIGSTVNALCRRMEGHRTSYRKFKLGRGNNVSIFKIFDLYGTTGCKIELLEEFPCDDKVNLKKEKASILDPETVSISLLPDEQRKKT